MSLTFLGWLLIVSSIVIPALVVFSRSDQLPLDIGARLKTGKSNSAASSLQSSRWGLGRVLHAAAGAPMAAAAVFLVVAGIGAATSYVRDASRAAGAKGASDGEMLTRLEDYTRSIGTEHAASEPADGKLLPDVATMIDQLAARLETAPDDIQGWRMLGWSYLNTGRHEQAAAAYARAVELDPSSAELKRSYEEAKAKASEAANPEAVSSLQTGAIGQDGGGNGDSPSVEKTKSEAMPPHESDAAIRSMVDGLADRLDRSPRDADGWTSLMRSRVVLGEREVAAAAFHRALEIFKDDQTASGKITAEAVALGLTAE